MASQQRDRVLVALVARQGAARARLEANTAAQVRKLVAGMRGRWYDQPSLDRFHRAAAGAVRQGQVAVANSTAAYLDRTLVALDVAPSRRELTLPADLRDVPAEQEWERPAKVYRRLRVDGLEELKAQLAAEQRAEQLVAMDLALAAREAASQRLQVAKVVGYRRVIHPELAKSGSCGLCVVASHQLYAKEDLLPLHGGCNCTVMPATVGSDPGLRINDDDLKALYGAAGGSTLREDLQRVRVTVNDHGELGPILTRRGDTFRDAGDVERDTRAA